MATEANARSVSTALASETSARTVSAALARAKRDDLLGAAIALEKRWSAAQQGAKARARALHGDVLRERQALQNALGTAAALWATLGTDEEDDEANSLALALRNVTHTLKLLDFFERVPAALDDAHSALTDVVAAGAREPKEGNAAKLYDIHAVLSAVERLRDIARLEGARNGLLPQLALRVEQIRNELDEFLMRDVFGDILSVAKSNPRFLVAAMRVVVAEERRDDWWKRYLAARRLQVAKVPSHKRHEYKQRFFGAVAGSINETFAPTDRELTSRLIPAEVSASGESNDEVVDVSRVLIWLRARLTDCENVQRFVAPCVPSSYNIVGFYERKVHNRLMKTLTTVLRLTTKMRVERIEHDAVLKILKWYSAYREGSGRAYSGVDEYLDENDRKHLVSFMRRHVAYTVGAQVSSIVEADESLGRRELSPSDAHSVAPVSPPSNFPAALLISINELVKHVSTLGICAVRKAVAFGISHALQTLQRQYERALSGTIDEPVSRRRPRYVCSVANNMANFLDYAEGLRDTLASTLDESDRTDVVSALENNAQGFRALAILALNDLTRSIEHTLGPLTRKLFAPHTGTDVMLDILSTLEDSVNALKPHLLAEHLAQLMTGCVRGIVAQYVSPFLMLGEQNSIEGARLQGTCSDYTGVKESLRTIVRQSLDRPDGTSSARGLRRSYGTGGSGHGLLLMSASAVSTQIGKDEENLQKFFGNKVEPHLRRQLANVLVPIEKIRAMYSCSPTPGDLVCSYQEAKVAVREAMNALGERCGPPRKTLTIRAAEAIWNARSDVNASVRDEAVMYANMGEVNGTPTAQKIVIGRNLSVSSRFSEATDSGMVWSPTVSVSRHNLRSSAR